VARVFEKSGLRPEAVIVHSFAAIAKSNSVLASTDMSCNDRKSIAIVVKIARKGFQGLLEAAAIATQQLRPSRGRSRSVVMDSENERATALADSVLATHENKKGQRYLRMKGRPNMHIALHYEREAA
jgi:hypothetical protein